MIENYKMKLKIINYFLIGFFVLITANTKANLDITHKFYVSLLNMKYDEKSKTFQLSFSIFIEDLEKTLEKQTGEKINLDEVTDNNEALVFNYVNDHFSTKVDGNQLNLISIGYEIEGEKIWVYVESLQTEIPDSLEIVNSILFELYREQQNTIKIKIGENDYSALITIKNPVALIRIAL